MDAPHRIATEVNSMTNLKQIRLDRGLTQREVAERSGVKIRQIQDLEQGHKNINGAAALSVFRIATALNTTIDRILEPEG